jgi:hypothetical protein
MKNLKIDVTAEAQAAQQALDPAIKRLTKAIAKYNSKDYPLGATADLLYDLRTAIGVLNQLVTPLVEVLEPLTERLEEFFINELKVGESSGVQGMYSRVQISSSSVPVVQDWDKFYAHVQKTGEFELLYKRVNNVSVKERWEDNKQVPGVGLFINKKVSCTKLRGKNG